ncbi:MAG: ATP-binding cassette domain-containing protein, partial [Treponemataceae bacterium]|nr:ATP-binding cassette domain-containing protein [Treponemataceae bacterium]
RRESAAANTRESAKKEFAANVRALRVEAARIADSSAVSDGLAEDGGACGGENPAEPLIEMRGVNVGWDGNLVLKDLSWTLHRNEHWLIRGPNGSGKTTFLELITGDNMQVFCNDVRLFGRRRGSGETVWDIRRRLGIVSYRLHVEYRMLGGCPLRDVVVSGFHDSIGLYEAQSDVEAAAAEKWLSLGGFAGRWDESFGSLSYGEQRAVLILRAAVKCPAVMILDEPCHGLDEQFRRKILDLLEIIAESRTTTLLHVTHEPSEVLPCEKHILELHPDEQPMYRILEL